MEYRDHLSGHNYPPAVLSTDAFLFLRFAGCPWQVYLGYNYTHRIASRRIFVMQLSLALGGSEEQRVRLAVVGISF